MGMMSASGSEKVNSKGRFKSEIHPCTLPAEPVRAARTFKSSMPLTSDIDTTCPRRVPKYTDTSLDDASAAQVAFILHDNEG